MIPKAWRVANAEQGGSNRHAASIPGRSHVGRVEGKNKLG